MAQSSATIGSETQIKPRRIEIMAKSKLKIIPIGGLGEIGKNMQGKKIGDKVD